jgi:hypothetical protein
MGAAKSAIFITRFNKLADEWMTVSQALPNFCSQMP